MQDYLQIVAFTNHQYTFIKNSLGHKTIWQCLPTIAHTFPLLLTLTGRKHDKLAQTTTHVLTQR
jgi:hypothetical protein